MPCGTRIAASTRPATRSERNHGRWYVRAARTPEPSARQPLRVRSLPQVSIAACVSRRMRTDCDAGAVEGANDVRTSVSQPALRTVAASTVVLAYAAVAPRFARGHAALAAVVGSGAGVAAARTLGVLMVRVGSRSEPCTAERCASGCWRRFRSPLSWSRVRGTRRRDRCSPTIASSS